MKGVMKFLKTLFIIAIILGGLVLSFLIFANYSSGFRAGVPTKISKKGVIFKTYEGTLNIGGLTNSPEGAIPTTWDFTVKSSADSVLQKINQAILQSKRVKLLYQEKYVKFVWFGDTKYYVYDVEILDGD
ncbi:MAG: hypothetical protein U5K79_10335 [Cyclobacteriaceae bacterium]|nr:hypothetical protein [Cyclobacteriaceae bacterium]